ncbi:molybdopterin-guanine dinucleotide biosynthesis protein B [Vibrio mangrovi]|uniref:Molybdopterin-guanine dinucleotide biosynthesis adapter protein n=1 Tax=Vibrio mangrovi TaxID=474394 RepID=A0A1Y6IQS6_9VIBR|nr:molybdopterin-guanine dinucleotide biosynthesis protein B [Vibrio mangrovi]MDW6004052.1 molybdopterin-guanine dinucleotide biosynthesis protein B [Vibrio mangrovi]SMR99150.1 Molybdopterin-guanine dinucleotide biosynthesis adapter protein [Vibrio mangrovi]
MTINSSILPNIPVLGFAAFSGTGKTTLLESLIPELIRQGIRVGVYKHSHHVIEQDQPGKDSFRLRKAGASQTLLATPERAILTTEFPDSSADFYHLLQQFDTENLDVILIEGCKEKHLPKIELHRHEITRPWLYPDDPDIIAVATDVTIDCRLPCLNLNDVVQIAEFIQQYIRNF